MLNSLSLSLLQRFRFDCVVCYTDNRVAKECIRAFRHIGSYHVCVCIGLCHVDAADHWPGFIAQLPSNNNIIFRPTKWKKKVIIIVYNIVMHRLARRRRPSDGISNVPINFLAANTHNIASCGSLGFAKAAALPTQHRQCPNADCVRTYIQSSAAANRTNYLMANGASRSAPASLEYHIYHMRLFAIIQYETERALFHFCFFASQFYVRGCAPNTCAAVAAMN